MILITGASGSVGKAVLHESLHTQSKVRAMFRSKEDAANALPGCEPVIADYKDKPSLLAALNGVTSVYVVCSPIPQLVELESNMLEACQESGVKHVVLNSALGAADFLKSFPAWHRKVEDKLKSMRMTYTILRPNGFLQNIAAFYGNLGDSKTSYIDVTDIAVVAVKSLGGAAHIGKIYELNGPEAISNRELAKRISKIAGRIINYVDLPDSAYRDAMVGLGMPEWQVTALMGLHELYQQGGGAKTDSLLKSLIERDPVTLDQYLAANAQEFRAQAASA